jgi:putative hydrolase of the HAD superfamily
MSVVSIKLLLFDLDETIAPDEETDRALFAEIAETVAVERGVTAERLVQAVIQAARTLWLESQTLAYSRAIGISSWEGLWGPFGPSEEPMLAALHAFAPIYRLRVWEQALAACDIRGGEAVLAATLAERFATERRARQTAYPWSRAVLEGLRACYRLGMITNGAPDLQRLKLAGTGLAALFDPLVISGDLGFGKPERAIFDHALDQARTRPEEAIMVGDSWHRDVVGATGAGLRVVWVNPTDAPPPARTSGAAVSVVRDLRDLPGVLGGWEGAT